MSIASHLIHLCEQTVAEQAVKARSQDDQGDLASPQWLIQDLALASVVHLGNEVCAAGAGASAGFCGEQDLHSASPIGVLCRHAIAG